MRACVRVCVCVDTHVILKTLYDQIMCAICVCVSRSVSLPVPVCVSVCLSAPFPPFFSFFSLLHFLLCYPEVTLFSLQHLKIQAI